MKQTRNLLTGLVACAVAMASLAPVWAQTPNEGSATVIRVKGPARYTTGNNTWQKLTVGTVLHPGAIVQTSNEKDSFVDLVLGDVNASVTRPAMFKPTIPSSLSPTAYQPTAAQNVVRLWQNTA